LLQDLIGINSALDGSACGSLKKAQKIGLSLNLEFLGLRGCSSKYDVENERIRSDGDELGRSAFGLNIRNCPKSRFFGEFLVESINRAVFSLATSFNEDLNSRQVAILAGSGFKFAMGASGPRSSQSRSESLQCL
jgi:hypothetical protein